MHNKIPPSATNNKIDMNGGSKCSSKISMRVNIRVSHFAPDNYIADNSAIKWKYQTFACKLLKKLKFAL